MATARFGSERSLTVRWPRRMASFAAVVALAVAGLVGTAATTSAQVLVNTKTTLTASPPSSTFGQSVTFTATVAALSGSAVPGGDVTFTVDGVQVATEPLAAGSASIATASLAAGSHTIGASYPGNDTFNPSATTIAYIVGCGTTITGSYGPIVASGGSTCLTNATVNGSITVSSGAAIDIEGSHVAGSLNASGAGAIRICGSTISGSVTITSDKALVIVGDPARGCAINHIGGSLILENNSHGVRAVGNVVGGSLVNVNNSGPGAYPGDQTLITSHAPPVAVNDTYTIAENHTLTVAAPGVLANDSAPSGGTLTAALVTNATHGTAALNADGSFTYTPTTGFFGTDSFTYQDSDGVNTSNVATVYIDVHAAPVAANDSYVMVQGTTLTVAAPGVLANDSAPSGGTLTAVLIAGPADGSVALNADGSFTYTPVATFHGTDSFTYVANDGVAISNVATVTIVVNTPPSVTITKAESAPGAGQTVTTGQSTISYTFSAQNSGETDSGPVTLTDTIPAGATYVPGSATCPAGLTSSTTPSCTVTTGATTSWTFSSIPAGTTYSNFGFQVSVDAADANGSSISNVATYTNVNTPGCGTNATCPTQTVTNPVVTEASLSVIKSETSPGNGVAVSAGQTAPIAYGFTVANTGGTATGSVIITDPIPAGATLVAGSATCPAGLTASTTPSCTITTGVTTTWTFSSIPAGTTYGNFGFSVTVKAADADASTISNTATYTNVNSPNCGTNATCSTNTVTNPVRTTTPLSATCATTTVTNPGVTPSPLSVTGTVSVGMLPTGVVATATRAYVANSLSNTVSVLDTTVMPVQVIASIPVANYPLGMAISADGSQLYVTNYLAASLTIIQTSTNTVQHVVPVGSHPDGVVFFNNFVYVANSQSASVSQVDPNLGSVVGTIALPNNAVPSGLVVTPGGPNGHLYVDDAANGTTIQVNLPTTVAGTVAAGVNPAYIAALGSAAYVASPGDNSIKVLNIAGTPPTATTSIAVGAAPYGVVADQPANLVLATSSGANTVSAIDPTTNTVIGSPVAVGATPDAVAVSPDGATAFVTNECDGTVSVLHVTLVTMTGRAYGLTSSGLVDISPTPDTGAVATTTSSTTAPPCVSAFSGLISGHSLCAQVTTSTPPATSTATASVHDASIGVLGIPAINVGQTSSTSTSTCSGASGSATISSISVGGIPVTVATNPTANTTVNVLGLTLVFNEQSPVAGASQGLQVNAVHIKALGLLDVVIASSTSNVENCP